MKNKLNVLLTLLFLCIFIIPTKVLADQIYKIDIDMELLKDGSALVQEVWDVKADSGTEWYKIIKNQNNMKLTDLKVKMDGYDLQYKNWDIEESIEEKSGYYGINYISDGLEICFGKKDFKNHKFTISYKLSNVIMNLDDAQVLHQVIMPNAKNNLDNFNVTVHGYYEYPDNLDVWGYGYQGLAYVNNGKIYMTNDIYNNTNFIVILAKFPLNTFETNNKSDKYNNFNQLLESTEIDKIEYDYDIDYEEDTSIIETIFNIFYIVIFALFLIIVIVYSKNKYGYINNKTINKNNTPLFRDIPCNKDIFYANALIFLNSFGYKETNILGAIILKWIKEDKIKFITIKKGLMKKETNAIDLRSEPTFDYDKEKQLFNIMFEASHDGILETKELEKWCNKNYNKFLSLVNNLKDDIINNLKEKQLIRKRINKEECKYKNVMTDEIYNDSSQLYGLKLFLEKFSQMNEKEAIEVKLWDEYLMFAYLFGIADKVAKQLKNLYPEVLENMNFDYDTLIYINTLSTKSVYAASAARSAAESYNAGGGGFSSGGSGGFGGDIGSFGGR